MHSVNFYGLDPEDVMLGASAAIFCESDTVTCDRTGRDLTTKYATTLIATYNCACCHRLLMWGGDTQSMDLASGLFHDEQKGEEKMTDEIQDLRKHLSWQIEGPRRC